MLINAIRHGTTTLIDHHASPTAVRGSLMTIANAVKETGLRASLCYEVSDRDGEKTAQDGLDENAEFIKYSQQLKSPFINGMFGLHASFTINDKTLDKASKLAHDLNAGFHVHCAEAASDEDYNEKHFGMRVAERFEKFGILGPKSIAVHCVHINEKEMDLIARTNTMVAHNPQSNMNNAVGIAPVLKMMEKGILVGLGTDAMTVNMTEELRMALWLQHLGQKDPSCGFMEVTGMLFNNNAKIAKNVFGIPVGAIQEGFVGDVILVDYHPPTPLDETTALGHLVYGISQSFVDTTIVNGKVLMENKKLLLDIDEAAIAAKAVELTKSLWNRF